MKFITYRVEVYYKTSRRYVGPMHIGNNLERARIMARKPYIARNGANTRVIKVTKEIVYKYKPSKLK